jgi:hypothetical protein
MIAHTRSRRAFVVAALLGTVVAVAACSGPTTAEPPMAGMDDMAGMSMAPPVSSMAEAQPAGDGLSSSVNGYSVVLATDTVPAGAPVGFDFHISGPSGQPVTRYRPYESQLMLLDLVRSDLAGYQHIDPAMRQDGTWSAQLAALSPGSYRAYVTFAAPDTGKPLVYTLSQPFTVPGPSADVALPGPSASVHQGSLTVSMTGQPKVGVASPLTFDFTDGGKAIGYFQRRLDGYAHIVAFHAGDLAFAHLTPADKVAGRSDVSALSTRALFPAGGPWRLFAEFQTSGAPQTVAFTVEV